MADVEYKIKVTVEDERAPTSPAARTPQQAQAQGQRDTESGSGVAQTAIIHIASKAIQYGLHNYGDLTGDYIGQARINDTVQIATYAAAIIKNPVAGTVYTALSIGVRAAQNAITIQKANQNAAQLRVRVGEITQNGGR